MQARRPALEGVLIAHCAATLAGLKAGSLFFYRLAPEQPAQALLAPLARELAAKGVAVRLLRRCPRGCLIYVYRPGMLRDILGEKDTADFLRARGYAPEDLDGCLARLAQRIQARREFPHEVGVFLAYPLADVIGFITHGGAGCCCQGCWKAYGDPEAAQRRFALYRKCRRIYTQCYLRGFTLSRLTVTA